MITIMHANTCLLGADQVFTDDLYSLRRAMHDVSTDTRCNQSLLASAPMCRMLTADM